MVRRPMRGVGARRRGRAVERLVREQQHPARSRQAERGAVMQLARRDHEQGAGRGRVRCAADPVPPARLLDKDHLEKRVPMQPHAVQHVVPVEALQLDRQRVRGLRHEGVDGWGLPCFLPRR